MLRGIYIAAGGMASRADAIDVLANNMANVNTNGYKAEKIATHSFDGMLLSRIDDAPPGVFEKAYVPPRIGPAELSGGVVENRYIDFSPGYFTFTENPLDLALEGQGFFVVEEANGQQFYTRDGAFTINQDRYLVNQGGLRVLDAADRPIQIFGQGDIQIDGRGAISIDNLPAGQLSVVEFSDINQVRKVGNNLFDADASAGRTPATGTEVIQGAIEKSNVNAVQALTKLIAKYREFEAAARSMTTIDRTLDRVVNEVGRLSQ